MKAGGSRRAVGPVTWWLAGVLAGAGVLLGAAVAAAVAWRDTLAAEQRVLPGTVVAGTEVGLGAAGDLLSVAREAGEAALDRTVTVAHGGRRWEVSARDLDATTDARDVVAAALESSAAASPRRATAARWLGRGLGFERDVRVHVPPAQLAGVVDGLAPRVDREPVDATLAWHNGDLHLRPARAGARLDRAAATALLAQALERGGEVDLPVVATAPAVPTERLAAEVGALRAAVARALDRTLTVRHGDARWRITPRELDAVPHPGPLVEAVLDGSVTVTGTAGPQQAASVPLRLPVPALEGYVEALAADVDRDPVDATIDSSTGRIEVHPDEPGVAVDRAAAADAIGRALREGAEAVDLPVVDLEAAVTAADYQQVLLVRLDERRLYLYTDGAVEREWPVAVGAPGSATPTGTFTIGYKRHLPTWHNPAPEGWGAEMPEIVGPGPGNPLGLRALNWDRDGRDTLIRFHGTSEVSSIGRAASRGCVRLTNAGVVELYDLVESGTMIVSVRG